MSGTRNYKLENQNRKEYFKNYNKINKEKQKEYHKIWYLKNKEKVLKKTHDYYLKNLDKKTAYYKKWRDETQYNKKYYAQNKQQLNQYNLQYYKRNKGSISKQNKEWREKNQDKIKQYRLKNKTRILQQAKEYRLKNIEKIKQYRKEFEARPQRIEYRKQWNKANPKKSHGGTYPLELEIAMNSARLRDKNTCQWQGCGLTVRDAPIHVHHIFPRSEHPELQLEPWNMICYCLNHHFRWHMYRGDKCANILKANIITITEDDLD